MRARKGKNSIHCKIATLEMDSRAKTYFSVNSITETKEEQGRKMDITKKIRHQVYEEIKRYRKIRKKKLSDALKVKNCQEKTSKHYARA